MSNATIDRAHWLEPHDAFEGVGAHELNPRYSHVDGGGYDSELQYSRTTLPALFRAQSLLAVAPTRLDGFDGAHYQFDHGAPNLAITRAALLWWIAWKATQSTSYVDPTLTVIRGQWTDFEMRLLYHWLSSTSDPVAQADHFLASIGELRPGEAFMLDIEEAGTNVAKALACFERVESRTHRPGVGYAGLYVAGGTIWKSPELRMSHYGPRPFIVAAYVTEANLEARMISTGSQNFPHDGWQFSSNGPVPGINGRCDMDRIDNRPAFALACGIGHTPAPSPPQPQGADDMLRLLAPVDSPARFYAMCDEPGRALSCKWTGPGDDPRVAARIEFYRNATPAGQDFEMSLHVANLINVDLEGPIPPGFTAEQFGNPDEIHQRTANGRAVSGSFTGVIG